MTYKEEDLQNIVLEILTTSVTRKMGIGVTFETSDEEDAFFRVLVNDVLVAKLNPHLLYLEPMSNKSFSVHFQDYPIGRIKLSGRKTYIQVLKGMGGAKQYYDLTLEEYISHIPFWVKHIKYCLK